MYHKCHQKSISLEVFLKAFVCLNRYEQSKIVLHVFKETLISSLKICGFSYNFEEDKVLYQMSVLNIKLLNAQNVSESTASLLSAIEETEKNNNNNILFTLPTSKNQLTYKGITVSGHTDFFRKFYSNNEIGMLFYKKPESILLLTDHIPINKVSEILTEAFILKKVTSCIVSYLKINPAAKRIVFAGINPHAGEDGIIGHEDKYIINSIQKLKNSMPELYFDGPISGDTLHMTKYDLAIYAYHDQALSRFKSENKFLGLNISSPSFY